MLEFLHFGKEFEHEEEPVQRRADHTHSERSRARRQRDPGIEPPAWHYRTNLLSLASEVWRPERFGSSSATGMGERDSRVKPHMGGREPENDAQKEPIHKKLAG